MSDFIASQDPGQHPCGSQPEADATATAPFAPGVVKAAVRGLTKVQKRHILNGCISGDFSMATVRSLMSKGLFYHKITSPNGRCGPLRLTPLGETVRAAISPEAQP